jgi:catechol 2,3-dioxygenase-like lactoylglutathione lyase family enzyme
MQLDHIIVAVRDLDQAMDDYRTLGFTVFFGGQHAGGKTHNALICLADGSYIELIAPTDPANPPDDSPYLGPGRGFAGYALLADNMDAQAKALKAQGFPILGPLPGGRKRADGQLLAWRILFLEGSLSPFLIVDETPRTLRVPDDADKLAHANGAAGIRELVVAVPDLTAATERYVAIFGQDPEPGPAMDGAETRSFRLDGCRIVIAAATDETSSLAAYLREVGESPWLCRVTTENDASIGRLDLIHTHGARVELVGD